MGLGRGEVGVRVRVMVRDRDRVSRVRVGVRVRVIGLGVVERVTFPYDDLVVGEDLEGEQRCEAQPGQG